MSAEWWLRRALDGAPRAVRAILNRMEAEHGAERVGRAVEHIELARGNREFMETVAADDQRAAAAMARIDAALTLALDGDRPRRRPGAFMSADLRATLTAVRIAVRKENRAIQARHRPRRGETRRLDTPGLVPPGRPGLVKLLRDLGSDKREAEAVLAYLLKTPLA